MCKHILITKFNAETDYSTLIDFADRTNDNDGYGAIIRTKDNKLETLKSLSLPEFYSQIGYLIGVLDIKEIVVHHRTSTNGHGIEYSHPFEYQGHYLTHNGVISVPEKHDTKTTNDSEALLHHLIKTGYDTKSIQGYFSCFILSDKETQVIVDDTAPIYTDNRIFCSHPLQGLNKIALERIKLVDGVITERNPIEVTKTTYGSDKAYLSLGRNTYHDDDFYNYDKADNVDMFLRYISTNDEIEISSAKTAKDKFLTIKNKALSLGIKLTNTEIIELSECFDDSFYYSSSSW